MSWFRTGGGTDTSDANATAADILLNKTAYVDDEKITGSMANLGDISHTIGAGEVYTVNAGYTSGGTITAIAAGATITVTYTSDFYNKTMTCTKGTTTYTQTTTSSGSTTFSVAEGGTWTITCNGVSRQVDVVLEYTTQMAITTTITVYSAASDTVSFTDVTGAKTVTTNASGQGSVNITFIPNSTITFTSSIAKNPDNLSQAYSKTVTMETNITSIYVMPNGAIYWYGYYKVPMENKAVRFGGGNTGLLVVTNNTNDLYIGGNTNNDIGGSYITTQKIDFSLYSTLKAYVKNAPTGNTATSVVSINDSTNNTNPLVSGGTTIGIWRQNTHTTPDTVVSANLGSTTQNYVLINIWNDYGNVGAFVDLYALWLE